MRLTSTALKLSLILPLCGFALDDSVITRCELAPDQSASFNRASLRFTLPVPTVIDPSMPDEIRRDVQVAIDQWNAFARKSLGKQAFLVTHEALPQFALAQNAGLGLNRYSPPGKLVITRGKLPSGVLGLTPLSGIRSSDGAFKAIQGLILLNSDVNAEGRKLLADQQVLSVALHELGHALGLDHSCEPGKGKEGFLGCEGLSEDHPYRTAVMYPSLSTIVQFEEETSQSTFESERKEQLNGNDRMRAYCASTGQAPL
jgi:hypothetical protein